MKRLGCLLIILLFSQWAVINDDMVECVPPSNNSITDNELSQLINRINNLDPVRDREQINYLRTVLDRLALQYNINLNNYLEPQLQHTIIGDNTGGNSGVPNHDYTGHKTPNPTVNWTNVALCLAGVIIVSAFVVHFWGNIRDLFVDNIPNFALNHIRFTRGVVALVRNNPELAKELHIIMFQNRLP